MCAYSKPPTRGWERNALFSRGAISFTWGFSVAAVGLSNGWDLLTCDVFGRFFVGLPLRLATGGVGSVAPPSAEGRRGFTTRCPIEDVETTGQKGEWTRTNIMDSCGGPRCMKLSFELKCALTPRVAFFGCRFRSRATKGISQFEGVCYQPMR